MKAQSFHLLAPKTLILPEAAKVPTKVFWVHNQPEIYERVTNVPNTLAFLIKETRAIKTQFYKLWVHSHHSGVSLLPSQVSYHPCTEQWLWICHFGKDELILWILRTFCGHFIGNSQPISRYLSSLTPNRMSLRSFKWCLMN